MRIIAIPVAALTLTVLAACGTDGATAARPASPTTAPVAGSPAPTTKPTAAPPSAPATTPSETPTAKPTPSPTATPVHFDTPEAAMRYLADAYNHDDLAALKKVTNPTAREALAALRSEAVNLHLETCTRQDAGRSGGRAWLVHDLR